MFKVYAIHSNKTAYLTNTFFVKIDRKTNWLYADIKINNNDYFSDELIENNLLKSAYSNKFKNLKEGQIIDIKYGSSSNNYHIVKMTKEEIQSLNEIKNKTNELNLLKEEINNLIPVNLINKQIELEKELDNLKKNCTKIKIVI